MALRKDRNMIEVEASVEIQRPSQDVWDYVSQLDKWWLVSNPDEHIELSVIGQGKIEKGTELVLKERIAGVRGEAIITISKYQPPILIEWKSLTAQYSLMGMGIEVSEGGTFKILPTENGCILSHKVWGEFGRGIVNSMTEWFFKSILKGEQKDYIHTHNELLYIKEKLEV
jgi:hypothetical protein